MNRDQQNTYYDNVLVAAKKSGEEDLNHALRYLCLNDLFFLLTRGLGRIDINRDWLFDRCVEVQASPDNRLDLWAREHYKSTIITYGQTIRDILNDPEITVGIFSHTKPIARAFLRQIKKELEDNERLKFLFPEILYADCKKASNWSEDKGITVKRKANPKEATVEAHGLVDGQPTSKHFNLLVYDDVVTRESVTTPEMIKKVTEAWELSLNLGAEGGRKRYIGTRYHFNDTYKVMIDRGSAITRIHPATDNGKVDGQPVFLSKKSLADKRRDQGSFVFACQQLQNPKADDVQGFRKEDLRYYNTEPDMYGMNLYILVDPANEKKKKSDYTAMWVVGLAPDRNYYIFDIVRDKMNLSERAEKLMELHRDYQPDGVAYEQYSIQADIQHLEYLMEKRNYRFSITPVGGRVSKNDRIRSALVPILEANRMYLPNVLYYTNYEGEKVDLVNSFILEELEPFPFGGHDDLLDGLARIRDPELAARFPGVQRREKKESWRDKLRNKGGSSSGYMAA